MSRWSIVNKQDDNNMIWVCTFPIGSMLAYRFAYFIGQFIQITARGLFGEGNTLNISTNEPDGVETHDDCQCPQCGGIMITINITQYDDRVECSRCKYFIIRDAC